MQMLTLEEFKILAQSAKRIAVFKEIPMVNLKPIDLYHSLSQHYQQGIILENLEHQKLAHFSYLCFEPIATLCIYPKENRHPYKELRHYQKQYQFSTRENMSDYITNAAGFITYDTIRCNENIPDKHTPDMKLPEFLFSFYTISITFCYLKQTILVSCIVDVEKDTTKTYQKAQSTIDAIISNIDSNNKIFKETTLDNTKPTTIQVTPTDDEFIAQVKKAKDYIKQGEVFQIVLSRCFKRKYDVEPLHIYKTLGKNCPAPFMFYIPFGEITLLGASPERFIRVQHRKITVNPIAGTRKRSFHFDEKEIEDSLLGDEKELAEHMMLVDLARNDVGAVAKPGSVNIDELLKIKNYSHVSHITSTISGELKENKDAFDAFTAAFPAGTLSGAPKIRAMQLIDDIETSRRGIYGGAICRLDSVGNLDSCIAIRMAVLENGVATIRTGAGIVYDSNPHSESQETYHKASSMLAAIAIAHGEEYDFIN